MAVRLLAGCLFMAMYLVAETHAAPRQTNASVLLLPGEASPLCLRLDVVVDGKSPEAAWEAFLDRLFDHFDADGDGALSRREVSRIMPLPLPGGKELVIDFDRLDTDKDGKGSRAELKAFCRGNGFTPVVLVIVPPSADDLRLANLFASRLDANRDGKLTRDELRRAPEVLRKYDINDDEYLDLAELLVGREPAVVPTAARLKVDRSVNEKNMVLRIDLGGKAGASLGGKKTDTVKFERAATREKLFRLRGAARWWLTFRAVHGTSDAGSVRDFLIAQFQSALGDASVLSKAQLEEDAALAGFLELLPYADRNADGKLSLAELRTYLDLVALGLRAQVWVTATDHDRNPFHFLDRDGDGRLSYREQVAATDLLGDRKEIHGLPWQFDLSFGGPAVKSWGGVAIPAVKRRVVPPADISGAPAWFRAMDRNRDGVLSPREFIGPPELFHKLDVNGDGVITPEEAVRLKKR